MVRLDANCVDPKGMTDEQLEKDMLQLLPHAAEESELNRDAKILFRYLNEYLDRKLYVPMGREVIPTHRHKMLLRGRKKGEGNEEADVSYCVLCAFERVTHDVDTKTEGEQNG